VKRIAIVDYGLGNLFNVEHALLAVGADPVITSTPADLESADGLVIPGVGAFGEGMRNLERVGLIDPIRSLAREGKPTLGICLGMQLLMDESEEFGRWPGLGLVSGNVVRLGSAIGERVKIPQIGWNSLDAPAETNVEWEGTLLDGIAPGAYAYFVHSYAVRVGEPTDALAETSYGGARFCSVAARGNVMGCQFHPEKSADVGLRLLLNWLRLCVGGRAGNLDAALP
jgi:glutamine amidotransferase